MHMSGDIAKNWEVFRAEFEDFMLATGLTEKTNAVQAATLRRLMGNECRHIYMHNVTLTEEQKKDPKTILDALGDYFKPAKNVIYERYTFGCCKQGPDEPIDSFITTLREKASSCEYRDLKDELIRDRLVLGIASESTRRRLLRERDLTLPTAVEICRLAELTESRMRLIESPQAQVDSINSMVDRQGGRRKIQWKTAERNTAAEREQQWTCKYCGNGHKRGREQCPAYALKARVKEELDKHVKAGNLTPVTEPTAWISNMVTVAKPDKIRICIDPKPLNQALLRSHYHMPTLEDVLYKLPKARVFTLVDARDAFLQCKLDEESSRLTTFWTPWGRMRWLKLPFGVSVAPEIYQRKQHELLSGLAGIEPIADDILVVGCGDTDAEAEEDHNTNLRALMQRCRAVKLRLSERKLQFKLKAVHFHGHVLSTEGLKIDPEKTQAVLDMPTPTDAKAVQRMIGFVTYLAKFLPGLSEICEPLRRLLDKDTAWHWLPKHDDAIREIKRMVTNTPVLKYYDVTKPVTIQSSDTPYVRQAVCSMDSFQVEDSELDQAQHLDVTDFRFRQIAQHTEMDDVLQALTSVILRGWPDFKEDTPLLVREYWPFRDELNVQNSVLYRGQCVVIPKALRAELLRCIHTSHIGGEACYRRARDTLFWPNMRTEIKDYVSNCSACNEYARAQQKESLMSHDIPTRPWQTVSMDTFSYAGQDFIVLVDHYSDFWEIDLLPDLSADTLITRCKSQFARYGQPDKVLTDNGPQFACEQFRKFAAKWGFNHVTSSPRYPKSNGKAESAVKIVKSLCKRAKLDGTDKWQAILHWRNTPTEGLDSSPAQRLMSRRLKTSLPVADSLLQPWLVTGVTEKLRLKRRLAKSAYDISARDLPELNVGEHIRMRPLPGDRTGRWQLGQCLQKVAPHSFVVEVDVTLYRRNRVDLRVAERSARMRQLVGPEQSSHTDRGHVNAERAAGGARTDPVQDDTGLGEPPHSPGVPAQGRGLTPGKPVSTESQAVYSRCGRLLRPPQRLNL
ncbi:uncharacterized protein K02A2.6-like [Gymnodraco acuticeps]|uniref:Gypsy retrotransposon integrase-like protein 1 n=1 Tax=Gymnodraco acuticeps TaxID=8218 RepID=A0A6P8WE08_GYMAC|nr:uncharacterized protein K02A2.6-like [Gymnodraco acuticeps]